MLNRNRFTLTELVEGENDGKLRRNAGLHFVNAESGESMLVRLDQLGHPTELWIADTILRFHELDPAQGRIRWQLFDENNAPMSDVYSITTGEGFFDDPQLAPSQHFGRAQPQSKHNSHGNSAPRIGPILYVGAKRGCDLGVMAAEMPTSRSSAILAASQAMILPYNAATALGASGHQMIDGVSYGLTAAQCATYVGSLGVPGPGWALTMARMTSGTLACAETVQPIADAISDVLLQNLETRQKVEEFMRIGAFNSAHAGSSVEGGGGAIGLVWTRNHGYCISMNSAISFYREARVLIETELPFIDQAGHRIAHSEAIRGLVESIDSEQTMARELLGWGREWLALMPSEIVIAQEQCAVGIDAACGLVPMLRDVSSDLPLSIPVFEGVIEGLTQLKSSIGAF